MSELTLSGATVAILVAIERHAGFAHVVALATSVGTMVVSLSIGSKVTIEEARASAMTAAVWAMTVAVAGQ